VKELSNSLRHCTFTTCIPAARSLATDKKQTSRLLSGLPATSLLREETGPSQRSKRNAPYYHSGASNDSDSGIGFLSIVSYLALPLCFLK
jgi:hypothetical protein